jgi:hypothetical protein
LIPPEPRRKSALGREHITKNFCGTSKAAVAIRPTIPTQIARSRCPHGAGPDRNAPQIRQGDEKGADILRMFHLIDDTRLFRIITTNRQSLPGGSSPHAVAPTEGKGLIPD